MRRLEVWRFLARKWKMLYLRDTLKLPAKGVRRGAHPLFGQTPRALR
jgi:hypothetical protein